MISILSITKTVILAQIPKLHVLIDAVFRMCRTAARRAPVSARGLQNIIVDIAVIVKRTDVGSPLLGTSSFSKIIEKKVCKRLNSSNSCE